MPVREVCAHAMSLRVDNPDFLGAMSEVKLQFEIELGGGVGFGRDLDGKGGSTFEVASWTHP